MILDAVWLARVTALALADHSSGGRPLPPWIDGIVGDRSELTYEPDVRVRPSIVRLRAVLSRGDDLDIARLWRLCDALSGDRYPMPARRSDLVMMLSMRPISEAIVLSRDNSQPP